MNCRYMHPRDELVLTMGRIDRCKMTTTSGGNLSALDENGDTWISPAGVDKEALFEHFGVPENTAERTIGSQVIGGVRVMPEKVIKELQQVFKLRWRNFCFSYSESRLRPAEGVSSRLLPTGK